MRHLTLFYLNAASCSVSICVFAYTDAKILLGLGIMNAFCALCELKLDW